jgi:hypothetical protein
MKVTSIEPTPSPNTMKLTLDIQLPIGQRFTYKRESASHAPESIRRLLDIPGVLSIFHTSDFLAIERITKFDWQGILSDARSILGGSPLSIDQIFQPSLSDVNFGQAHVMLQMFRNLPLQVRVRSSSEEVRLAMPDRFTQVAIQAGKASSDFIKERKLVDLGIRYGDLHEIAHEIILEQEAMWSDSELQAFVNHMLGNNPDHATITPKVTDLNPPPTHQTFEEESVTALIRDPQWKVRYSTLKHIKPSLQTLPLLLIAQQDEQVLIRRLATVYLGDIKNPVVLPHLYHALQDRSPIVRRTAGDTLSDLGDPQAIPAMILALKDVSKLVRWRAARFLYEVGDESCLPALQETVEDDEFEVRMQAQIALERIYSGNLAEGTVWQQMTKRKE